MNARATRSAWSSGECCDQRCRVVVGFAATSVAARPSQSFDVVVQVGAAGLRDDLAEQRTEPPDVVVQRREAADRSAVMAEDVGVGGAGDPRRG